MHLYRLSRRGYQRVYHSSYQRVLLHKSSKYKRSKPFEKLCIQYRETGLLYFRQQLHAIV